MKLKDLTGAIRPGDRIEIVEVAPFSIYENMVFSGTLMKYFEQDAFKKLKNKKVLQVNALSERSFKIVVLGEQK